MVQVPATATKWQDTEIWGSTNLRVGTLRLLRRIRLCFSKVGLLNEITSSV